MAIPGVFIGGIYISPTDIAIPLLYVITVIDCPHNGRVYIKNEYIPLYLYCLLCACSVLLASVYNNVIYLEAFFKVFRLVECLMVIRIIAKARRRYPNECATYTFFDFVIIMGMIAGCVGIYLFLTQSLLFNPTQLMSFNGHVMRRAEGYFGDAQTFSLMMAIVFIIALSNVFYKRELLLSCISLIISFIAIVFSDTRAAFFAVVFAIFAFVIFKCKEKTHSVRIVVSILLGLVLLSIVYNMSAYVNRFINERVLKTIIALFSGSANEIAAVSSHRLELWTEAINRFYGRSIFVNVFGSGYKVKASDVADNQFIYSLITTGVLGFVVLVYQWIVILSKTRRIKSGEYIHSIRMLVIAIVFVFMLFADSLTLYRPMYLFFIILGFTE